MTTHSKMPRLLKQGFSTAALLSVASLCQAQVKPNIVYILADDLGLGDVRSYTTNSPVNTPNIDSLATSGMRFTNAHSPSAVCTPTRYGVLTGQYAWRTSLQSGVIGSHGASLIDPARQTVAEYLGDQGYDTAMFGKWHLGIDWVTTNGQAPQSQGGNVDYTQPFGGGPTDNGFDTYFGDDVINFPPYAYIENDQVQGVPSVPGPGGSGNRPGLATPDYQQVDSLPAVINRATQYIGDRAQDPDPFFMYLPLSAPHSPIVPPAFIPNVGTSYDRFIATVDWAVGEVIGELAAQGIDDETMIVFTSDNGVSKNFSTSDNISPGFVDGTPLRGQKADIWEAGHRIPLLVRWDGAVQAGSESGQYVELNDLFATAVDLLDADAESGAMGDSVTMLPALLGDIDSPQLRSAGVNHSINGTFAVRQIDSNGTEWKLIFNSGSGGWTGPAGTKVNPSADITNYSALQLYNMTADVGEQNNLLSNGVSTQEQLLVDQMHDLLRGYISLGVSVGNGGGGGGPVSISNSADARLFHPNDGSSRDDNNGGGDVNLIGIGTNGIENFGLFEFGLGALAGETVLGDVTLTVFARQDNNAPNRGGSDDTISVHELFDTNQGWAEGSGTLSFADKLTDDGSVSFENYAQYNDNPGPPSGTSIAWKDAVGTDAANLLGAIGGAIDTQAGFDSANATLSFTIPQAIMQDWIDNGFAGLVFRAQEGGGATAGARFILDSASFEINLVPAMSGDTDGDGDVDDSDLGSAFANYTGPVGSAGGKSAADGDTDGDGDVDDSDLGTAFANYTGPLAAANVPEPATLSLLGFCGFLFTRRRTCKHGKNAALG